MDVINFPVYKKWYKENKAVWNSKTESTDWLHYFYQPSNNLKTKQDLRNYPASYWEDIRQLSYKY